MNYIGDIGDAATDGANWAIGLQRYIFPNYSVNDGQTQMADFVLRCNQLDGTLEYSAWTYGRADGDMTRVKLPYIDGLGSDYNWKDNPSNYVHLKIELENQKVTF